MLATNPTKDSRAIGRETLIVAGDGEHGHVGPAEIGTHHSDPYRGHGLAVCRAGQAAEEIRRARWQAYRRRCTCCLYSRVLATKQRQHPEAVELPRRELVTMPDRAGGEPNVGLVIKQGTEKRKEGS